MSVSPATIAPAQPPATVAGRKSNLALTVLFLLLCGFIALMNQVAELKDRDIYVYYYDSLDSCEALGCLLISDDVRSPIFLSIIILGHRLGLSLEIVFTLISTFSLYLFTRGVRDSLGAEATARYTLITLGLGTWLYLIQVKLFLAVGLYVYARARPERWLRIVLTVASVLTHESILFFIALYYAWQPKELRISMRSAIILAVLGAVLLAYLGASTNVFLSSLQRIQKYNEYAAAGVVPTLSRLGLFSASFFLFGLVSIIRMKVSARGTISWLQLKTMVWMFLPWTLLMVFASNAVFAIRLAELALLQALLVVPIGTDYRLPSRIALLLFCAGFGALTFVRDVLLATAS